CQRMTKKKKILVIDDERITTQLVQVFLERYDFEVVCAYDGVEGIEVARAEKPDLILLDIVLPKKDGFDVCEELRSDPSFKDVRILMFTAMGYNEDIARSLEVGANDHIIKPFSGQNLLAVIKKQLGL
ncbi:MAG: response regulator, partial [Candidatus Thorarchaeota archaeon]|nr:response regulator [Candidatus Thorarchaeota archaeon]